MKKNVFYKPSDGFVADVIPFYDKGEFKLFYLHDYRNRDLKGEGTPWYLITTNNFVDYIEHGEVLPRGSITEQDLFIFTGSVIKDINHLYHIFYTGHNPHNKENGKPVQAVMHATSTNLVNWTKLPQDTFYASGNYDVDNWRDPFVYYCNESSEYKMLLTTRKRNGKKERAGVTIMYQSKDLTTWNDEGMIWDPNAYFAHECPDIFKIGDWWYLIYSEFTDKCLTRYVMSKDIKGPWAAPINDSFDGRAYYAAKSSIDSKGNRYLFGWNPTKENGDNSSWQWGGNLVVHEIFQLPNNTLGVRIPKTIKESFFSNSISLDDIVIDSINGQKEIELIKNTSDKYAISFDLELIDDTYEIAVKLQEDVVNDNSYAYVFSPKSNNIKFDNLPNSHWRFNNFKMVEKPFVFKKGESVSVIIVVENNICISYVNDEVALSSRMYTENKGSVSLSVKHGRVLFKNIKLTY